MPFDSELDTDDLERCFERARETVDRNFRSALEDSANAIADRAIFSHGYTDRTRELTRSIHVAGVGGIFESEGIFAIIEADAPHAASIEYGSRPHIIRARRKKFLRFKVGGKTVFAKQVRHPGTDAHLFLTGSLNDQWEGVQHSAVESLRKTLRDAGFEVIE